MSLINQMLKDLEKRKAALKGVVEKPAVPGAVELTAASAKRRPMLPGRRSTYYAGLGVVVVVLLAVALFSKHEGGASRWERLTVKKPAAALTNGQPAIAKKVVAAYQVSILDQNGLTQVNIQTVAPAHYQVTADKADQQQVLFTVIGLVGPAEIPVVAPNSLLANITAQAVGANTQFTLTLKADAMLQSIAVDPQHANRIEVVIKPIPEALAVKPIALTPEQKAQQAYQAVLVQYNAGHVLVAKHGLELIVQDFPDFLPGRIALIKLDLQQQQWPQAAALIQGGLLMSPGSVELTSLNARLALLQGNTELALERIQSILPSMKEHPDFYTLKAAILRQASEPQQAGEIYEQLIAAVGSRPEWWLGLALSLQAQGYNNAAAQAYRHVSTDLNANPGLRIFAQEQLHQLGGN